MANYYSQNDEHDQSYFNGYLFQRLRGQHPLTYMNHGSSPSTSQAANYLQFIPDRQESQGANYLQFLPDRQESRATNNLQFVPDEHLRSGAGSIPGHSVDRETTTRSQESSEKSKRCSWSNTEIKCLITAYRENYERLKGNEEQPW